MTTIPRRYFALAVLLLAAGSLQWLLMQHVRAAGDQPAARPTAPLAELPTRLGEWTGEDRPIDPQLDFADDALHRVYRHGSTGQQVVVWIAYSAVAADRGHHPQVCMAVLGKHESEQKRALLPLAGHDEPVQQMHFGQPGEATWTFYWHYGLADGRAEKLDLLQQLYRRARRLPASVTIEVFSAQQSPRELHAAQQFVALLDAALQPLVGPEAHRGSRQLPITIAAGG